MIPLKTRGKTHNLSTSVVTKITRNHSPVDENVFYLHEVYDHIPVLAPSISGILSTSKMENGVLEIPGVYNVLDLSHLDEGDIVAISPNGLIRTLFRVNSFNNALFVTERCNSNCLMCSQPPKNRDDIVELFELNKELVSLIPKDTIELGITGGEPTLMGDLFPKLLSHTKEELPKTDIHVLTNGRSFSWVEVVKPIADIDFDRIVFGVPLYSDFYQQHDYIVQAKNAFNQTITGLYNLARFNLRIEIRVVLHKQSIPRLVKFAKYIYKNLPFVEHIALMGLEYTGYTPYNIDKLWIDPVDYQDELLEAVEFLDTHRMNVSIYNHQLCTLPKDLWPFCRKSISAWKNEYLDQCNSCSVKGDCGGFFSSSLKKHSDYIRPIQVI